MFIPNQVLVDNKDITAEKLDKIMKVPAYVQKHLIYEQCNEYQFFTSGSNEQYIHMFDTVEVGELAKALFIIEVCTTPDKQSEVVPTMLNALTVKANQYALCETGGAEA